MAMTGGLILFVEVYFPLNRDLANVQGWLDDISIVIRRVQSAQVVLAGDFNARSSLWDDHEENRRSRVLVPWAVAHDIVLVNDGHEYTCVRRHGKSVVDLTCQRLPPPIDWGSGGL